MVASTTINTDQLELSFPDPSEFPSYDEVDSDDGQAEVPDDSYDETSANNNDLGEGCCLR